MAVVAKARMDFYLMCFDLDEFPSVYREQVRGSRKQHTCHFCNEQIPAGVQYVYGSGVLDSRPYSLKICRRCCYDMARIAAHELDEGCDWSEAFPGDPDMMIEYLEDTGMFRTPRSEVPHDFILRGEWPYKAVERLRKAVGA